MGASPANKHQQAPRWVPSPHCDTPPSTGIRRDEGVAPFDKFVEKTLSCHESQVITSEPQLAVIFAQRVVDKVLASITVDAQQTPHDPKKQQQPGTVRTGLLWLASHENFADGLARPLHAVLFTQVR